MTKMMAVAVFALALAACGADPVAPADTMDVTLIQRRPPVWIGTEPDVCHDRRMPDPHIAICVRIPVAVDTTRPIHALETP